MATAFQVRLLLPGSMMGTIIGKGGSNIAEVRTESSTKINIQRDPVGGDRVVDITGDENSIYTAIEKMFAKVAEGFSESQLVKVIAVSSQIGQLIGKQGAQIKEFRDGSGANIKVFRAEEFPVFAPDRCIDISGNHASILTAIRMMLPIMAKNPQMHKTISQNDSFAPLASMSRMALCNTVTPGSIVPSDGYSALDYNYLVSNSGKRAVQVDFGASKRLCANNVVCDVSVTASLRLEQREAGKLIGRNGATISEIRSSTGAKVTVTKDPLNEGFSDVEVAGNIAHVAVALDRIKQALASPQ